MKRDFSHIRSHRFREKRYDIIWRLPKTTTACHECGSRLHGNKSDGECDPPRNPKKAIRIGPNLPEPILLETAIHEALHAALWIVDEEAVNDTARDIAKFLTKMGFKLA